MSVAGKWQVSMDTPIGKQQFTWDLKQVNGAWQGTMQSQAGKSSLGDIEVNGDQLSFQTTVNSPMGTVHLSFAGAVASDRVAGTCKTLFGNHAFSGQRG